jgi:hypothetical protein
MCPQHRFFCQTICCTNDIHLISTYSAHNQDYICTVYVLYTASPLYPSKSLRSGFHGASHSVLRSKVVIDRPGMGWGRSYRMMQGFWSLKGVSRGGQSHEQRISVCVHLAVVHHLCCCLRYLRGKRERESESHGERGHVT